jgi:hypothetical protein
VLDEATDMMKESAKKRGDSETLGVLEPQLNVRDAIRTSQPFKPLSASLGLEIGLQYYA